MVPSQYVPGPDARQSSSSSPESCRGSIATDLAARTGAHAMESVGQLLRAV